LTSAASDRHQLSSKPAFLFDELIEIINDMNEECAIAPNNIIPALFDIHKQ